MRGTEPIGVIDRLAIMASSFVLTLALFFPAIGAAAPAVQWSPKEVVQRINPGTTLSIPITFTADAEIGSAVVRVVPALAAYARIEPSSVAHLARGESVALRLILSVDANALPASIAGAIQLRDASRGDTIAVPLPVTVAIEWPQFQASSGTVGFSFPAFGMPHAVTDQDIDFDTTGQGTLIDVALATSNIHFGTQYSVVVLSNSQYTSLEEWFAAHVDEFGILRSSGTFEARQLTNGMRAFVRVGEIPEAYGMERGPIAGIFAMSSSTNSVVIVESSNDQTMTFDLQISRELLENSLLTMLGTMQVP